MSRRAELIERGVRACMHEAPDEDSLARTLGFDENYAREVVVPVILDAISGCAECGEPVGHHLVVCSRVDQEERASGVRHYEYTCDAGSCDRTTAAVVLTARGWLSMCRRHAATMLITTDA